VAAALIIGVGACLDKLQDLVRSRSASFVVALEHAHLWQRLRMRPCLLIGVCVPTANSCGMPAPGFRAAHECRRRIASQIVQRGYWGSCMSCVVGHLAVRRAVPGYPEAALLEDDSHVIFDTIDACIFIV